MEREREVRERERERGEMDGGGRRVRLVSLLNCFLQCKGGLL